TEDQRHGQEDIREEADVWRRALLQELDPGEEGDGGQAHASQGGTDNGDGIVCRLGKASLCHPRRSQRRIASSTALARRGPARLPLYALVSSGVLTIDQTFSYTRAPAAVLLGTSCSHTLAFCRRLPQ